MPVAVFVKDVVDLRIVLCNQAAEKLAGVSADEILGKNEYDLASIIGRSKTGRTSRGTSLNSISLLETITGTSLFSIPESFDNIHLKDSPQLGQSASY